MSAFVKLGRRKGYRLVGVNRYGYNAFFVRSGLGADLLPEIEVKDCFGHPKAVWGMRERFPTVKDLPLGRGMNDGRPNHPLHLTAPGHVEQQAAIPFFHASEKAAELGQQPRILGGPKVVFSAFRRFGSRGLGGSSPS